MQGYAANEGVEPQAGGLGARLVGYHNGLAGYYAGLEAEDPRPEFKLVPGGSMPFLQAAILGRGQRTPDQSRRPPEAKDSRPKPAPT